MKVKIGKYPTHRWYHNWLFEKLGWKNENKVKVRIDPWDTWSMDHTLAHIIVPMLKQLRETKHGSPYVYPEDVPSELRPSSDQLLQYTKDSTIDDNYHKRWSWVIGEMIFAFESKTDDWEDQFHSGKTDFEWIPNEDGSLFEMTRGPNHTAKIDMEGLNAYQNRISKGFLLFGKYYEGLWD